MEFHKIPYVDFMKPLVEYSKERPIKSLYENNGKDINHYSPTGNFILSQAIAKRLVTDFDLNDPEPFHRH